MTTDAPSAAIAELDGLTAEFVGAEKQLERARLPIHDAIVRHLHERNAPPGKIAEHSPFARNYVRRIAKEAGVVPLRGRGGVYDPQAEAKALKELDRLTDRYETASAVVDEARERLREAIIRHYTERALLPGKIAEHTPYDRNWVGTILRDAGAPPIRG